MKQDQAEAGGLSGCAQPGAKTLEERFLEVYEQCAEGLFRFACLCTHEPGGAEEAVQQAFLDLFAAWREGAEPPRTREWLYRAVRLHFEAADRTGQQDCALAEGLARAAAPPRAPDFDAPVRERESFRRLSRMLSPREFQMLQLRAEEFSYEEIGAILGVQTGTVASTMSRTLRKVRRAFREELP
jgi:RNA polymerase sigma factor (sigma-70 family)